MIELEHDIVTNPPIPHTVKNCFINMQDRDSEQVRTYASRYPTKKG